MILLKLLQKTHDDNLSTQVSQCLTNVERRMFHWIRCYLFFVFTIIYGFLCFAMLSELKNQKRFLSQVRNIPKLTTQKKTVEIVKEELFDSILETENQDDVDLDEVVRNTNNPQEVVILIKRYESIPKRKNMRIINVAGNQRLLLKTFQDERWIFGYGGIEPIAEVLQEYIILQDSNLELSYFKTNFRLISKACRKNLSLFKSSISISYVTQQTVHPTFLQIFLVFSSPKI